MALRTKLQNIPVDKDWVDKEETIKSNQRVGREASDKDGQDAQ